MLINSLSIPRTEFEQGTGWQLKPEGACKGDVCIPLKTQPDKEVDVAAIADDMNLSLVGEPDLSLWALGPDSVGGKTLLTAEAPELNLPDVDGKPFKLSSLKGKKIVVYAWAPY